MIDVVIPYRLSPFTNSLELKYCLRSIEKHVQDLGQIILIGDCPGYINDSIVNVCPFTEWNWYQYLTRNIHDKLMIACKTAFVSDRFLYMNDDHFLLEDIYPTELPAYHGGKEFKGSGKYNVTIASTIQKLQGRDYNNFDIHAPLLMYKKAYLEIVGSLNWKIPFGYCIKTMYCNGLGLQGEYYPDYKLDRKPSESDFNEILTRKFFSIGDKAFTSNMLEFLHQLYPHKSKYEI